MPDPSEPTCPPFLHLDLAFSSTKNTILTRLSEVRSLSHSISPQKPLLMLLIQGLSHHSSKCLLNAVCAAVQLPNFAPSAVQQAIADKAANKPTGKRTRYYARRLRLSLLVRPKIISLPSCFPKTRMLQNFSGYPLRLAKMATRFSQEQFSVLVNLEQSSFPAIGPIASICPTLSVCTI